MATKKTGSAAKGGKGLGSRLTPAQQKAAIKGLKTFASNAKRADTKAKNKAAKGAPFGMSPTAQRMIANQKMGREIDAKQKAAKQKATKGSAGSRAGGKGGGGLDAGLKAYWGV